MLDQLNAQLLARADAAAREVMERHQDRVAQYAQSNHAFQNRTGTLQASIAGGTVTGGIASGRVEGVVEASAPYASFVIGKTGDDFLQRAADATAPQLEAALADALSDAIQDVLNQTFDPPETLTT